MKFKIKYADQIVGSLSILAIAALIFIIFLIGSKQNWFVQKHPYYTIVTSASNVSEGMSIQYKGFAIGKIKNIALNDNDEVVVNFYILDDYIDRITEGSIIELSVSPIGLGSSMIFHPGVSTTIIENDSLIPERNSRLGMENIKNHKVMLSDQTDSITNIVNSASDLVRDIDRLVRQVSEIISGRMDNSPISKTINEINTILSQISAFLSGDTSVPLASITDGINDAINQLHSILNDVNTLTNQLQDPQGLIPKLLETEESKGTLDSLFATLNQTMTDINNVSASLGNNMPQVTIILAQVQTLIKQVQDVVVSLKNNPLIKGNSTERIEKTSATPKLREETF